MFVGRADFIWAKLKVDRLCALVLYYFGNRSDGCSMRTGWRVLVASNEGCDGHMYQAWPP